MNWTLDYRPATPEDAENLFRWRNDPITRAMSVNTQPIEWVDHVAWLDRRLARQNPNLYIVVVDGDPVGTFRLDDGEVSYTIAPEFRGRGFATWTLSLVRNRFGPQRAVIKAENTASIRAAQKAGHVVELIM